MADDETTAPTITLDDFLLLEKAGQLVLQAQQRLHATPEWQMVVAAEAHHAALHARFRVPRDTINFQGDIAMITRSQRGTDDPAFTPGSVRRPMDAAVPEKVEVSAQDGVTTVTVDGVSVEPGTEIRPGVRVGVVDGGSVTGLQVRDGSIEEGGLE